MGSLMVVALHPRIKIGLQLLQRPIDLLPKRHPTEFVQHCLMEPFADSVRLGMPSLRTRVIDFLNGLVHNSTVR